MLENNNDNDHNEELGFVLSAANAEIGLLLFVNLLFFLIYLIKDIDLVYETRHSNPSQNYDFLLVAAPAYMQAPLALTFGEKFKRFLSPRKTATTPVVPKSAELNPFKDFIKTTTTTTSTAPQPTPSKQSLFSMFRRQNVVPRPLLSAAIIPPAAAAQAATTTPSPSSLTMPSSATTPPSKAMLTTPVRSPITHIPMASLDAVDALSSSSSATPSSYKFKSALKTPGLVRSAGSAKKTFRFSNQMEVREYTTDNIASPLNQFTEPFNKHLVDYGAYTLEEQDEGNL